MTLVYGVIGLVVVFAIAAVVIGREARRLDAVPPRPVFDMDEAVNWVAEHLPFEVSAVLATPTSAASSTGTSSTSGPRACPATARRPRHDAPVVVGGAETVDWVLAQAQQIGSSYTAAQVHAVLDAQMTYLEAIGAIGPEAAPGE